MHPLALLAAIALTTSPLTPPAQGNSAGAAQSVLPVQSSPSSHPLSERSLANLVAFTRLLGYVRYFHPSDEAADNDWDAFTIAAVDTVESAGAPPASQECFDASFCPSRRP